MKTACLLLAASVVALSMSGAAGQKGVPWNQETRADTRLRNLQVIDNLEAGRLTDGYLDISLGQIQPSHNGSLVIWGAQIGGSSIQLPMATEAQMHQGAIPHGCGFFKITYQGTLLAALLPSLEGGKEITVFSKSPFPHQISFGPGGLLDHEGKARAQATFAARQGAQFTVFSDGEQWVLKQSSGVTFN